MAEHLPTQGPWKVRRWSMDQDTKQSLGSIYAQPREGHAYAVAMCPRYQKQDQWNADAAFIVKAVNSHAANEAKIDALVKALKPFADAARHFAHTIGPDGIDDGATIICRIHADPEHEIRLSSADFSFAASVLASKEGGAT